jgi:hypothetical protein
VFPHRNHVNQLTLWKITTFGNEKHVDQPNHDGHFHKSANDRPEQRVTNRIVSDSCSTGGSVDQRRSEIRLLAKMLSHLYEPRPRVGAMDDASYEPEAFAGVVPVAPDILFGNFCI